MTQTLSKKPNGLLNYFQNTLDRFNCLIPGGITCVTVLTLNTAAVLYSTGILFSGCIAGTVTCISLTFLYLKAPNVLKQIILRYSALGGWIVDVVLTATLTVLGFSFGATMGIIGLFLGLNISAMFSLVSWLAYKNSLITREEYLGKEKIKC